MKQSLLLAAFGLAAVASSAFASTNVNYTASADPNASPDANGNTVNTWTLSRAGDTAGQSTTYSGSYYATGNGILGTAWAIYSSDTYTPTTAGSYTTEADQNAALSASARPCPSTSWRTASTPVGSTASAC